MSRDFPEALEFARAHTRVLRARKNLLYTFGATKLPYICLSRAEEDEGEIRIRRGLVTADRPKIAVPGLEDLRLEGFSWEAKEGAAPLPVLLARRVGIAPGHYVHEASAEKVERSSLEAVADRTLEELDRQNDIRTAVLSTPDPVWPLALLLYVGSQIVRSAPANIAEHFDHLR